MTKSQNIVAGWYALLASFWAIFLFHRVVAFFFVFFLLAFALKVVNSVVNTNEPEAGDKEIRMNEHSAPLIAAGTNQEELNGRANETAAG